MSPANPELQSNRGDRHPPGSFSELYHTWRYLVWLVAMVLVVMLFYGEENWRGYSTWQSYKAKMAALGEPFNPGAFVPPPVPDEQNFTMTPALAPLYEFIPGTQKWRDPNAPQLFKELTERFDEASGLVKPHHGRRMNSWVTERTDLNVWAAAFAQPQDMKPRHDQPLIPTNFSSKDAAVRVLEGLSDFNPVLEELRIASARPYARFNLRYEEDNPAVILLPHLAKIKYLCRVLQVRASAHLGARQPDEAMKDLELLFYLANTTRNEPILISDLVRMAEVQLALQPLAEGIGQWSDSQLKQLQADLSGLDFCADAKHVLQAERVLFGGGLIDYFRRAQNKLRVAAEFEGAASPDSSGNWPAGGLFAAAPSGWLYLEQLNYNRQFEEYLLPVIDLKKHEIRPAAVQESDAAIGRLTEGTAVRRFFHHEFFSSLLLPALSKSAQKTAFTQTGVEGATIACALERYRLAHGQLPNDLNQLVPEYVTALPHDIINGKPLSYRLGGDGHYTLYSIGWNDSDDGGIVHLNKNGEPDNKEGDWVWSNSF